MESPAQRMFKREIRIRLDRIWAGMVVGKKGGVVYVVSVEGDESPDRPVHVHYLKPRRPKLPEDSKPFEDHSRLLTQQIYYVGPPAAFQLFYGSTDHRSWDDDASRVIRAFVI
ncbi:hypothetical protein niasHT_015162 [Heterodera trifolii]|uniref:Uncharacterized protein n=1 Tax=Heterodera trifolii TaxID=157864 RepID=A0ABD2LA15_9BILA